MSLRSELVARSDLGTGERDAMFALLDRCFEGVTRAQFDADLASKGWVILLRDAIGAVRGFTTLALERVEVDGTPLRVCFSGDTIVEREWWGSPALASGWIAAVRELADRDRARGGQGADAELVWLLICSGPRTYRFLPVFFREFHPRHDAAAPPELGARMAHLAARRYGDEYDASRGVVVLAHPQALRPAIRAVPLRRDAHVEHFERLNPEHASGSELVCYASLEDENLTRAGVRMLALGRRLASALLDEAAE